MKKKFFPLSQCNGINNSGQPVNAVLYICPKTCNPSVRSGYSFRDGRKIVLLK